MKLNLEPSIQTGVMSSGLRTPRRAHKVSQNTLDNQTQCEFSTATASPALLCPAADIGFGENIEYIKLYIQYIQWSQFQPGPYVR